MFHFFAYLARMKFIKRWGLMRNTIDENISEHSHQVAIIAHALALIKNKYYNGAVSPENVALKAIYHEASEVITGDLPTPIKYYNPLIKRAYKDIELVASHRIMDMLPEDLKSDYKPLLFPEDNDEWHIVKAADKICAYLKCIEELKMGNREFEKAERTIWQQLKDMNSAEVNYFIDNFLDSFSLTLDELN